MKFIEAMEVIEELKAFLTDDAEIKQIIFEASSEKDMQKMSWDQDKGIVTFKGR